MPLIKSKSKEAVGKNIKREEEAGRPVKQAVAIALDTQRRAKGKPAMEVVPTKKLVMKPKGRSTSDGYMTR